ncbi:MAG TPA: RNase adapter RapZ, partial [Deinococcales bacterium]|nr:RNase adapter RapZ [Deinococcales bacterium]
MERFVIISGLSGAGKTTALHALEELGYFTVDNLPPGLWSSLLDQCRARAVRRVAVTADARTREFLTDLEPSLARVKEVVQPEIVFLEASDEILIRRYGLTRRTHPLREPTLAGDLREERQVLGTMRGLAT